MALLCKSVFKKLKLSAYNVIKFCSLFYNSNKIQFTDYLHICIINNSNNNNHHNNNHRHHHVITIIFELCHIRVTL